MIEEYQDLLIKNSIYPGKGTTWGLGYTALGLTGEAGEVADKVKKILRDKNGEMGEQDKIAIKKELGDCLWYITASAMELGFTLEDVISANIEKMQGRRERGTLSGSGDDR